MMAKTKTAKKSVAVEEVEAAAVQPVKHTRVIRAVTPYTEEMMAMQPRSRRQPQRRQRLDLQRVAHRNQPADGADQQQGNHGRPRRRRSGENDRNRGREAERSRHVTTAPMNTPITVTAMIWMIDASPTVRFEAPMALSMPICADFLAASESGKSRR